MPTSQEEHWDKVVSPELGIQNKPQCSVAAETAAYSTKSIPAIEAKAAAQFRFRILVADDQFLIRETARQMLESEGYEVLTAADGLDGLHGLSKSLPDLIISDLNMPRMSGFEFLEVVRERFPRIATIAVSGEYISRNQHLQQSGRVTNAYQSRLKIHRPLWCQLARAGIWSPHFQHAPHRRRCAVPGRGPGLLFSS